MKDELQRNPSDHASYGDAPNMSDGERTISFLNRYFIYKKVRKVSDAEKVSLNLQHKTVDEVMDEARGSLTAKQSVTKALTESAAPTSAPTAAPQAPAGQPKPKIKINKQPAKKKLSTIAESQTAVLEPAAPAPAAPAPEQPSDAPTTVKKLKPTLKIVRKKNETKA